MTDDPLYLDDKSIAKKIGLKPELAKATFEIYERRGFPRPNPMIGVKRYWPAVRAFFDRLEGLAPERIEHRSKRNEDLESWD